MVLKLGGSPLEEGGDNGEDLANSHTFKGLDVSLDTIQTGDLVIDGIDGVLSKDGLSVAYPDIKEYHVGKDGLTYPDLESMLIANKDFSKSKSEK